MFSFKAIIASRGYHVYKETSWSNAKLYDEVKVELETVTKSLLTDPYACATKARHSYFIGWKTARHIPREISRYIYFYQRRKWISFWNSEVVEIQGVTDSFYLPSLTNLPWVSRISHQSHGLMAGNWILTVTCSHAKFCSASSDFPVPGCIDREKSQK